MTPLTDHPAPGEIGRSLKRIEDSVSELRQEIREQVAPMAVLGARMQTVEEDIKHIRNTEIKELTIKVDAATVKAAAISGGIGALGFLSQFFWPWKGH